ncbi:MAG: hypothetical protein IIY81_01055 [Lachnospiraceae bacterium]|nr:hypothetical protein [Lachnospiraceae bacterium]
MKVTMTIKEWKELMEYDDTTICNHFEVGERDGEYVSLSQKGEVFAYDLKHKKYIYPILDENSEVVAFDVNTIELRDDLIKANCFRKIEKIVDNTKSLKYL